MRSFLVLVVVGTLGFLVGCGGSGTPVGIPITIALAPSSASVNANGVVNIVATVSNDSSGKGVSWSLSGVGKLSAQTTTSVTYTAPATVTSTSVATVVATSIASPTVTASLSITVSPAGSAPNVLPISVNGGPLVSATPPSIYPNGAFASVQVCVPSTSQCQTIDGILVDTGSFGLRILASQLTNITLPVLSDSTGTQQVNDCVKFLDGSFLWGTVSQADILLGGEVASQTFVQVIGNPTSYSIPTSCSSGGNNEDTQLTLGANGILGVGPEATDCGFACDPAAGSPPVPAYYICSTSAGCQPTSEQCGSACAGTPPNQQVTNPVFNFPVDNNGVVVELPAVNDVAATVDGSLIFGIGTQANNGLGSATVFTLDNSDNFITNFNNQSLTASFIDSGSNGLFFPDASLPLCSDPSWYCPANTTPPISATNVGATGSPSNTVSFSVDNFDAVTSANPTDAAFSNLAGPNAGGFDWGLPFFYNRNVYTAIRGTSAGSIAGPFWAY